MAYVIAEAGVNHNGDMKTAFELVLQAKRTGADAVKFQLFTPETLATPEATTSEYQPGESMFELLKRLALEEGQMRDLAHYAKNIHIDFICTPCDPVSLEQVKTMEIAKLKIASCDITNIPFLKQAAESPVDVILSTGMADAREVFQAANLFKGDQLILMQCTGAYPTAISSLNLRVMEYYRKLYRCRVGFSDHSDSLMTGALAVAAGASVIEKHFTLDPRSEGPDHKTSLDLISMGIYIHNINEAERAMGSKDKEILEIERANMNAMRKFYVAARDIKEGSQIHEADLATMRTGGIGLPPNLLFSPVARIARKDIPKGTPIEEGDFAKGGEAE